MFPFQKSCRNSNGQLEELKNRQVRVEQARGEREKGRRAGEETQAAGEEDDKLRRKRRAAVKTNEDEDGVN